jgi:membrane-bound acyltransferase YfiQ involved in biofilm formation
MRKQVDFCMMILYKKLEELLNEEKPRDGVKTECASSLSCKIIIKETFTIEGYDSLFRHFCSPDETKIKILFQM